MTWLRNLPSAFQAFWQTLRDGRQPDPDDRDCPPPLNVDVPEGADYPTAVRLMAQAWCEREQENAEKRASMFADWLKNHPEHGCIDAEGKFVPAPPAPRTGPPRSAEVVWIDEDLPSPPDIDPSRLTETNRTMHWLDTTRQGEDHAP